MPRAKAKKAGSKGRSKTKTRSKSKRTRVTKSNPRTRSKTKSKTNRKKRVTLREAKKIGDKLKVDFNNVSVKTLQYGMNVELEHGYIDSRTNVTNNNLILTAKIALAHIVEFPDYYDRLKEMEDKAEKYWKNKKKVDVFKNK